jgi:hypothetical protein
MRIKKTVRIIIVFTYRSFLSVVMLSDSSSAPRAILSIIAHVIQYVVGAAQTDDDAEVGLFVGDGKRKNPSLLRNIIEVVCSVRGHTFGFRMRTITLLPWTK